MYERINGCMQRSMNGLPLPEDSKELEAMAYMEWLSFDKPRGNKVRGNKFLPIEYPDRQVDLKREKRFILCIVLHVMALMGRVNAI